MLRESSLFAAGVRWQVGNVCCFDLQQLHLREVDGVILKRLNERKYKVWQLKAGKKNNANLLGFPSVSLWVSHHLPGA